MHINLCMHGRMPHLLLTKEIYGNPKDWKKQNSSNILKEKSGRCNQIDDIQSQI